MHPGHEWFQSFQRLFSSPTVGIVAVAALVGVSVYAIADVEPVYRPHHVTAVFGPR